MRLMPADTPRREDGRHPAPETAPAPAPAPQPHPAPLVAPAPAVAAATPAASAAPSLPAAAAAPAGQPVPDSPADAAPLVQMPSRYRVRLPEPVLLTYTQTRQAPGAAPQTLAPAHIDWRSDGERYQLQVDGVLGRLSSQGGSGDAGVMPRSASEENGGSPSVTEFDNGEVRFRASGRSVPDSIGIQDRASLLMQLAGIGLGEPDQLRGTIEVVVAGPLEATIERFQAAGVETLATALGPIEAWHLAQPALPGRPRLEVWLAPARGWLPVQLRLTGADGIVSTQTVSAIAAAPAAPAAAAQ
ncbi:hypothetical protein [Massilia phyllosphaerae]|uniref:hypothetical protein n=1 Tax=Massilia phyllosphaerae TaxID=3106034 RepID=UPI002B1CD25A|nr:hypothetical protein [Massilia sp. SGZ-792]